MLDDIGKSLFRAAFAIGRPIDVAVQQRFGYS
jgi:hypothetical protein